MSYDEIKPDKVRRGRTSRWKFTQTPQWALLLSDLSDAGYRIYSVLIAHVNNTDDDSEAWPQQETIGKMLGRRREAVSRVITKELSPLGLVDIEVERYGTNNSRRRNIYTVHELPPEDFTGVASVSEWYADNPRPTPAPINRRERKNAGQTGRAKNRTSGDAEDRAPGSAKKRTGMTRRGTEMKGDTSSPPSSPSAVTSSEPAGKEDEIPTKHSERAQALVTDAVRRWPRNHRAPGARDAHRLAGRVAAELADGGDEGVILHELTRDLQDAGSAIRVILGARTTTPGWGRPHDPRPDHARYEVRTSTPWCGRCDERTRQLVAVGDQGEERMLRCRHCHPDAAPAPAPVTEDVQEDEDAEEGEAAAPDPEVAQRMQAELEAKSAAAREKREQQLAATKKMLAEVRAGASTEAAAREKRSSRNRRP